MKRICLLAAALVTMLLLQLPPAVAEEPAADDAAGPISYFRDVKPIFQQNCMGCHQPAKPLGGLVMTTFAELAKGGESGEPAIVPGRPEASYVVAQISAPQGKKPEMPKDAKPLAAPQIELISRWIAEGAKDDTPESAAQPYDAEHPPVYHKPPVITSLDVSPDGQLLAVSGYHEVLLHKADGSELVARLVGLSERIESAVFSPDGTKLATAGGSPGQMGEIQIWDVAGKKLLRSVSVSFDTLYGASWSPDGKLVAFGCPDNTVRAVEVETGKEILYSGAHDDWVLDTVFSTKGTKVISVSRDFTMKLTDLATQRFEGNITTHTPGILKGGIPAVDRHPQKDELVAGGDDGVVKVFKMDVAAAPAGGGNPNQLRAFAGMPGRVFDVKYSADGKLVVAGSSFDGTGEVRVFEEGSKQVATMEGIEGGIFAVAFAPDSKTVYAAGFSGEVFLCEATTGKPLKRFVSVPLTDPQVAETGK